MSSRLLVTGSRLLTAERHADAIEQGLIWCGKLLGRDTVLVHGGCPPATRTDEHGVKAWTEGLDELARLRWEQWGLPTLAYPADWGKYGLQAGPIRDAAMVYDDAQLAMAWPFPDPSVRSVGTWLTVAMCLEAHITVLSGWDLRPILSVPELPPAQPYAGPMPHQDALL